MRAARKIRALRFRAGIDSPARPAARISASTGTAVLARIPPIYSGSSLPREGEREMSRIVTSLGLLAVLAVPVAAAAQSPTFTKDIAPIFQNKCEACHRPDSIAPMSLVSFEESRPWARSIKNRVASRQMPPWHIDKTRRHHRVRERSIALGQGDRDHREVGRCRLAEGRSEGHAGRQGVAERAGLELRQDVRAERTRSDRSSRCPGRRRPVPTTRGGSPSSRRISPSRAGSAPSRFVRARSRAARSRITRSPACSSAKPIRWRRTPTTPTASRSPARSWNGPSASRAR